MALLLSSLEKERSMQQYKVVCDIYYGKTLIQENYSLEFEAEHDTQAREKVALGGEINIHIHILMRSPRNPSQTNVFFKYLYRLKEISMK